MIVHDSVIQGTAEWHRIRAGVITASNVSMILAKVGGLDERQQAYVDAILSGAAPTDALAAAGYKKAPSAQAVVDALAGKPVGKWSESAQNYAFKLAVERITGKPLGDDEFTVWQAKRGQALEEEARFEDEVKTGETIVPCGFVTSDDGKFGCSPDGLVGDRGGVEYKCFLAASQLRSIILGQDWSAVRDQCQVCMALTGRDWWRSSLYVPDLRVIGKHYTSTVHERDDDYIDNVIWPALLEFDGLVEEYRARLMERA